MNTTSKIAIFSYFAQSYFYKNSGSCRPPLITRHPGAAAASGSGVLQSMYMQFSFERKRLRLGNSDGRVVERPAGQL